MTLSFRLFKIWEFVATRAPVIFGHKFYKKYIGTIKGNIATFYLGKKFVPKISKLSPEISTRESPETIWQFWDKGVDKAPEVVRACWRTVEKHKENKKQIILDMQTLPNYTDLPGIIYDRLRKNEMSMQSFSDVIRINLLKNQGGYWMDSTDYMTAPIPKFIEMQPFFIFHDRIITPKTFIQSCFIRSEKKHFLAVAHNDLMIKYWTIEDTQIDYFTFHLMFRALIKYNKYAHKLYLKMPYIDQESIHRVSGGSHKVSKKLITKFDADKYANLIKDNFFQKLTFKGIPEDLPSDSFLAQMIKMA